MSQISHDPFRHGRDELHQLPLWIGDLPDRGEGPEDEAVPGSGPAEFDLWTGDLVPDAYLPAEDEPVNSPRRR